MKRLSRFYIAFSLLGALLLAFIAYPLLKTIFAVSFRDWVKVLRDTQVLSSVELTFLASALATGLALIFGVPLAYLLAKGDFAGKHLISAIVDLPIVVPHSAAGIALLMTFGRHTLIGKMFGAIGVRFVSSLPGIVIAMLFVSLSYLVNAARDGFASVDARLEGVARTLGATPWQVFWLVSLPLAWRNVLSGIVMMWARGLSEFGAVVILAYHPMVTPVLIFERFESYGLAYARPVTALIILISLAIFAVMRWVGGDENA